MRKKNFSIYILGLLFLLILFPNVQNVDWEEPPPIEFNDVLSNITSSEFYGVDTVGFATDVCIQGNYAYVADHGDGFQVVDISDVTNPTIVKNIPQLGGSWVQGVDVQGNYAYFVDFSYGLQIVNITDPTKAETVSSYSCTMARDVYVKGNYAYVATLDFGPGTCYVVVNITDPLNPVKVTTSPLNGEGFGITGEGNYIYLACTSGKVCIINATEGSIGDLEGTVTTNGNGGGSGEGAGDLFIHGDYLYYANGKNGTIVIDVSDKTNPAIVANLTTLGYQEDIYVDGNFAYVASRDCTDGPETVGAALEILNVTNPREPELLLTINATSSTSQWPGYYGIKIEKDYAFLADRFEGLKIVKIGGYDSIQNLTHLDFGFIEAETASQVEIMGDKLFVDAEGWKLVNITDQIKPVLIGNIDEPCTDEDEGDFRYNATGVYNISSEPIKIADFDLDAIHVSVKGDYAYVTKSIGSFGNGLIVYNISDPTNPINIKEITYDTLDYPGGIGSKISGNYLYDCVGGNGLFIINITNPLDPIILDNFVAINPESSNAYHINDVAISGDYAYIVGDFGIYVLKTSNHYIGDPDNDGLDSFKEYHEFYTNPFSNDTDMDGLLDNLELDLYETDPTKADTDGDLMPDKWELDNSFDPKSPTDGEEDGDNDGLINSYEYLNGTKFDDPDSDDDGINDGNEVNLYGTNPLSSDSDNDLLPDKWEITFSTDPLISSAELDPDNDGLSNLEEYNVGTLPQQSDTDGDNLLDGAEINIYGTNASNPDTDGDTYNDDVEIKAGSDPTDPNDIPKNNLYMYLIIGVLAGFSAIIVVKQKTKKKAPLNIFLSHAMLDFEKFNLLKTASILEKHSAVDKVFYCERDTTLNIDEWMEKTVPLSQILFYYVSSNSLESKDCDRELELARINKIPIVPILAQGFSWDVLKTKNLNREIGFEYKSHNFNMFKEEIIDYIDKIKKTLDDLLNVLEKNQISNIEIVEKELNLPAENIQDFTDTLCKIGYISGVWNSDKTEFWNKKEVLHKMKSTNNFNNEKDLDKIISRYKIHTDSIYYFKKIVNWKDTSNDSKNKETRSIILKEVNRDNQNILDMKVDYIVPKSESNLEKIMEEEMRKAMDDAKNNK